MEGTSGDVSECVTVWATNMDWHQRVAGQSGRQRFMGMNQFVGGLVRTQGWHWIGSSHAEGCNSRQLHLAKRGILSKDTCMRKKHSKNTRPKAVMGSCCLAYVAGLN